MNQDTFIIESDTGLVRFMEKLSPEQRKQFLSAVDRECQEQIEMLRRIEQKEPEL